MVVTGRVPRLATSASGPEQVVELGLQRRADARPGNPAPKRSRARPRSRSPSRAAPRPRRGSARARPSARRSACSPQRRASTRNSTGCGPRRSAAREPPRRGSDGGGALPRSPPASARTARSPARPASSRRVPCGRRGRARSRAVEADLRLVRGVGGVEDDHLDLARRGRRASRTSSARPTWCGSACACVISPPTVTQAPSGLRSSVGDRAVGALAQQVADVGQRMAREEDAERLLLAGEQLDASRTRPRASAGSARRRARADASPASPRSKIDPWPESASSCAFAPDALRLRPAPSSMPLRVAPVESSAPHLIRLSIAFLLTVRAVDARAEVPDRGERARRRRAPRGSSRPPRSRRS